MLPGYTVPGLLGAQKKSLSLEGGKEMEERVGYLG